MSAEAPTTGRQKVTFGVRKSMYRLKQDGAAPKPIWPPTAGYYEHAVPVRFAGVSVGAAYLPVCVWYGVPHDPETGEPMDRAERWQAIMNGFPIDLNEVWPYCSAREISQEQYLAMMEEGSK